MPKVAPDLAATPALTGNQYMDLLLERQRAWIAEHDERNFPPLLHWFVRDGDEKLVDID